MFVKTKKIFKKKKKTTLTTKNKVDFKYIEKNKRFFFSSKILLIFQFSLLCVEF
jgi:hypothetical protein